MNKIYFATYNSITDSIEIYVGEKLKFVLNCTTLNNNVYFEDSLDIAYLHRLAKEEPICLLLTIKKTELYFYNSSLRYLLPLLQIILNII